MQIVKKSRVPTSQTPPSKSKKVSRKDKVKSNRKQDAKKIVGSPAKELWDAEKWQLFVKFHSELSPIVQELNQLMEKYSITLEGFILFPIQKNKIVPFINYSSFPGIAI